MDAANEAAAPLFAAALAFATLFAVIPLILLVAGVIGWLIQDPVQREALLDQLVNLVPPLADLFEQTLDNLAQASGTLSIIGLVGLLWGSSSFYGALDEVMRRIFPGGGIRDQVARRIRGSARDRDPGRTGRWELVARRRLGIHRRPRAGLWSVALGLRR